MAIASFGICLMISLSIVLWMSAKDYENVDRYYWTVIILIPVIILGYWLKTMVVSTEAAAITFCFISIDGTILLTIMIFLMLRTIGVTVSPWMKGAAYLAAILHLFVVWGCVHNDLYYKEIHLIASEAGTVTKMDSGPLRIYHYIYIGAIFATIVGIILVGFIKKGTYSRQSLIAYTVVTLLGITIYGIEWAIDIDFSLLPYLYVLSDLIIALQYDRIHSHDISCIISGHQKDHGTRGYASFDKNGCFLSCNRLLIILGSSPMIEAFEKRDDRSLKFQMGEMTCVCDIAPFSIAKNSPPMGYIFDVRDATEEQNNIDRITFYNESLNTLVQQKTRNILEMQAKIVTGMANMIENRDNNTGGHVKRTSDIIRIVIDELRRQNALDIKEDFARDIVRAAPMHDLGKISIENAILNKPSKLTDEEYEIMKTHAAKSGEMVKILLDGVEEEHFVQVAFHVARYHHERWDGRGYPEGLVGSMIPVEARIMAIADVYDALASKRSYKEAMDPKLVAKIMLEGMGTQFDPALKPVFIGCRTQLEAYYAHVNAQE